MGLGMYWGAINLRYDFGKLVKGLSGSYGR